MIAHQVADILLKANAVKLNVKEPFTYTSGLKGPIYTDNRLLISYPEYRDVIIQGFIDMMNEKGLKPEYLVGPATGGIPWAAIMADRLKLPMVYVRSKPKGHGTGKQIEGYLPEGKSALIIEDLFTTGGSAIRSVEVMRGEGKAIVHDVFAIFSYATQKSEENFRAASCAPSSLTDVNVLLEVAEKNGDISAEDLAQVKEYFIDPPNWGPNKQQP